MPTPRVLIIVVMYNSFDDTAHGVSSFLDQDFEDLNVLIVNNGSADDSGMRARELYANEPRVSVLDVNPNRGFSGGVNAGVEAAFESGAEYVWVLADDIRLERSALSRLVEALDARPSVGLAGQLMLLEPETETVYFDGGVFEFSPDLQFWSADHIGRNTPAAPLLANPQVKPTEWVTGASMFFRAAALRDVGGMDPTFWLYYEDVDLSKRVSEAGWELVLVEDSICWHDATESDDASYNARLRYAHRNRLWFNLRHHMGKPRRAALLEIWSVIRDKRSWSAVAADPQYQGARDFLLGRTGPIARSW